MLTYEITINTLNSKLKSCVSVVQHCLKNNAKGFLSSIGAGEGIRTLDFNLGKVALYP